MTDDIREELEGLEGEPWLAFWLKAGDKDLEDARVRFAVSQKIAIRELHARHETIELRVALRGMLTTCFISEREDADEREWTP